MTDPIEIFTSDSDAWDDTALIKAWDSTITSFKSGLSEGHSVSKSSDVRQSVEKKRVAKKKFRSKKNKSVTLPSYPWKVGDQCQAKYEEDGLYYPADIIALCDQFATVCYVDYDETCDVKLTDLDELAPDSLEHSRTNNVQPEDSHLNFDSSAQNQKQYQMMPPPYPPPPMPCPVHHHNPYTPFHPQFAHSHGPIPQPPCPPHPFLNSKCTDEALASMLMSWYKTGFSTGYYQALREHNISQSDNGSVRK